MLFLFSFFLSAIILLSIILLSIKNIVNHKSITFNLLALNFLCFFLLYVRLEFIINTFVNPAAIDYIGISRNVGIGSRSSIIAFYFFPIYSMFLYSTIYNFKRLIIIHLPLIIIISLQISLSYVLNYATIEPFLGIKVLNWSITFEIIYLLIFFTKYISLRKFLSEHLRGFIVILILIFIWVIYILAANNFSNFSDLINDSSVLLFNLIIVLTGGWIIFHPRVMSGDVFWESKLIDKYTRTNRELFFGRWDMEKISKNTKALTILDIYNKEYSSLYKILNEIVQLENKYILSETNISKSFEEFFHDLLIKKQRIDLKLFFENYSGLTFKKYIKQLNTIRAKKLIENGFLMSNGTSDLAKKCGFNNRISLFNNFIKTFGYPPTQVKVSKSFKNKMEINSVTVKK